MSEEIKLCLLYEDPDGEMGAEYVRGVPVENGYRIDSIPFFASNIARGDVVTVEVDGTEHYFDTLVAESGASSVQVAILDAAARDPLIARLQALGVEWDSMGEDNLYLALNVPAGVDYRRVRDLLDAEAAKAKLDYREACVGAGHA